MSFLNGARWLNGAIEGILSWNPTGAAKNISLPDKNGIVALTNDLRPKATSQPIYYVNPSSGSDTNDGLTSGTAFATIQKAIDVLASIDCNGSDPDIIVLAGNYTISSPIVLKNLVGVGTRCTIKSQGGTVTLTSPNTQGVWQATCTTLYRWDGITFATNPGFGAFRALGFVSGTSLEIKDCKFRGGTSTGDGVDGVLAFNSTVTFSGQLQTEQRFDSVITCWGSIVDLTGVNYNATVATVFNRFIWARGSGVVAYATTTTNTGSFTGQSARFDVGYIAGNFPPGSTAATFSYPTAALL